ncbi:hypothetical protein DFH06DRAFT_1335925 [Mycena polygramma]|nr:hypothetical protein DFH06DRAFT_1335925 [Mycena polygramma]
MTDDAQKKKYFTDLLPFRKKDVWTNFSSYESGSYEAFLKDVYLIHPEVKSLRSGSLKRLEEICQDYKAVDATKEGLLRRFGLEFQAQVNKLERAPALITNVEAVDKYLNTLEPNFARDLHALVQSSLILTKEYSDTLPKQSAREDIRKEDPISLKDLIEMSESMAENYQLVDTLDASLGKQSSVLEKRFDKESSRSRPCEQLIQQTAGLIPIAQVFNTAVEPAIYSSFGMSLKGDIEAEDELEPGYGRLELLLDEIRTLKARLAKLERENSSQPSICPPLVQPEINVPLELEVELSDESGSEDETDYDADVEDDGFESAE